MADNSALRTAGDLGPLRIQTPPKAGYGAAAMESPLLLQFTPPRDSLSTNPQPHSKLTMHYQGMIMLVSIQNISFPVAVVPPFSQGKGNFTTVNTCVGCECGPSCGWWHVLAIFHFKRQPTFACADWRESVCADGEVEVASFGAHWACDFDISRRLHETRCSCPRAVREPGREFQTLLVQTVSNWTEFADLFRVTSIKIIFKLRQMLLTEAHSIFWLILALETLLIFLQNSKESWCCQCSDILSSEIFLRVKSSIPLSHLSCTFYGAEHVDM